MVGSASDIDRHVLRSTVTTLGQLLEAYERSIMEQATRLEQEAKKLYQKVFDYGNDGILISDPELDKILEANPRACAMLDYSLEELLATPLSAVHPYDLPQLQAFAQSVLEHGMGWTDELRCVTKTGTAIPAEISASSIDLSGQTCIVALVRDISERRRHEERARELAVLEERHRLARDLHDSVTQSLYSLTLFAEAGGRAARDGRDDQTLEYLAQLGVTAQQALKEMRLLVYQLRPEAEEVEGLAGSVERRLEAVERRAGMDARLEVDEVGDMPRSLEKRLLPVVHEALNNSLKHSGATGVAVRLARRGDRVEVAIEDDGRGFRVEAVVEGGMGLANMRERVEELGGSLTIDSRPGSGTRVRLTVPEREGHR